MQPDQLLDAYDRGRIDRRGFLTALGVLLAAAPAAGSTTSRTMAEEPTFRATGLDHIALAVSDPQRSSAFYQQHLGLSETSNSRSSVFLDCGSQFVALFRSQSPGLAHYSYALPDYSQASAAERLRRAGLSPKLRGNRTYFDDPDGIEVQVSRG